MRKEEIRQNFIPSQLSTMIMKTNKLFLRDQLRHYQEEKSSLLLVTGATEILKLRREACQMSLNQIQLQRLKIKRRRQVFSQIQNQKKSTINSRLILIKHLYKYLRLRRRTLKLSSSICWLKIKQTDGQKIVNKQQISQREVKALRFSHLRKSKRVYTMKLSRPNCQKKSRKSESQGISPGRLNQLKKKSGKNYQSIMSHP